MDGLRWLLLLFGLLVIAGVYFYSRSERDKPAKESPEGHRQEPTLLTAGEHAEDVGLVTGLLTNGRRLSDWAYLDGLLEAGLDHIQITIESHDEAIHDQMVCAQGAWRETVEGIKNSVDADIYLMTNPTLTDLNVPHVEETIDFVVKNPHMYSIQAYNVGRHLREYALKNYNVKIEDEWRW